MIVVIRNASGFDLFLAISADEKAIRFRIFSEAPEDSQPVHAIRPDAAFALQECPESLGVRVNVSKAGLSIRVARRREIVDHLDEFNDVDGEETYLEFTLHLLN